MDPQMMAAAAQATGAAVGAAVGGPNVSGGPTKVGFDNSGWSVATAGSSTRASSSKTETDTLSAAGMGNGIGDWVKWVLLAVVAVAAIKTIGQKVGK